jgi:hypothetical protein
MEYVDVMIADGASLVTVTRGDSHPLLAEGEASLAPT